MRRRRLLTSVGLLAVPAAGCTDDADTGAEADEADTDAGPDNVGTDATAPTSTEADDAAATDRRTPTPTAAVDDLDLREANVTGIDVEASGDDYRFSVTLIHDDDGENGYADWWQVETFDGRQVGRRDLAHPHGTREFARSKTVSPPDGADCIVVRGHDRTHGYGGQAAVVAPDSGATRLRRQGESRSAFDASDCP